MAKTFSGGIVIATGFKLQDPQPIDDRMSVDTYADLATLDNVYEGHITYVVADKDHYRYINPGWESMGSTTETDPTVPAWVKSITSAEKTNWNTAFGWGNHTSGGYEKSSNKGVASGYVPLDSSSKIPASFLPPIAVTDTFVVASQVAMLALTAETGDVAIRTDESKSYILQGADPTILAGWQELLSPSAGVTSVNGLVGDAIVNLGFSAGSLSITGGNSINLDSRYIQDSDVNSVFGRSGVVTAQSNDYTADQIAESASRVFLSPAQKTAIGSNTSAITGKADKATTIAGYGITDFNSLGDARYLQTVSGNYTGNANSITAEGKYKLNTGATNIPAGAVGAILIHYEWDANAKKQIFYQYGTNNTYERFKQGASWSDWRLIWNDENSFTKSGTLYDFGAYAARFGGVSLGNDGGNNRITGHTSETQIRFLNISNSYATVGVGGLSVGSSYAALSPPSNGIAVLGNVGIGTRTPSEKLEVEGNIKGSGNMTIRDTILIDDYTGNTVISQNKSGGSRAIYVRPNGYSDPTFQLGLTSAGAMNYGGSITAASFFESSDERLKEKIEPISETFREFELKSQAGKRYGVIAQEIEKTNPELVKTDDKGMKSVNYIDLLCKKVSEQENDIKELKRLVKQLINKG